MAKPHVLNFQPERMGGGFTFARLLYERLPNYTYEESDTVIITGPTMASHDEVAKAKADGKNIILRLDNACRNSNNRGTGMTRMKAFADMANTVIYQSEWARDFLIPYTKKDGPVILNGVDTKRFYPGKPQDNTYLYVRSSRDEGKQWIMAWYWFANNPGNLSIVGKFSPENLQYNFDFFNNERFRFYGIQENMPDMFRNNKYFLYTYLNDACSNTLLEARASGCEIIDVYGMLQTGGAPEIMACEDISIERMIKEYKECLAAID